MRRRTVIVVGLAALLAVVVPVAVIAPTVPPGRVSVALTPSTADGVPLPLVGPSGGSGVLTAPVSRGVAAIRNKAFQIRLGTYVQKPSARIVVSFLAADGVAGTICRFAAADYRDSAPVECRLKPNEHPASIRVRASGAAGQLAVWGSQSGTGKSVGRWFEPASGGSLGKRLGFAYGAIDALRPTPFRVPLLIGAIALASVLAAVLLTAVFGLSEDPANVPAPPASGSSDD